MAYDFNELWRTSVVLLSFMKYNSFTVSVLIYSHMNIKLWRPDSPDFVFVVAYGHNKHDCQAVVLVHNKVWWPMAAKVSSVNLNSIE